MVSPLMETARFSGPSERCRSEALDDLLICFVEEFRYVEDAVTVDGIRQTAIGRIVDNQGAICGAGLEVDVRVVKVGAGGAFGRPQLVVEVVLRRDGPLTGHGRAVREGRGSLSEAMPVLLLVVS